MAIQSFQLDPNAGPQPTPDEIVAGVNAATADITRAGSVDPTARPIEADEITATHIASDSVSDDELTDTAARDNLRGMAPVDRGVVLTEPQSGEFPIINVQRQADGKVDVDYDDVAIP